MTAKSDSRTTSAERYMLDIYDGKIVSGEPMRRLADKLLPRFTEPYRDYRWDRKLARRPVEFIERFCVYPTGAKMGKPFVLEPYEKAWVEIPFGFVDENDVRQIREVLCEVARKNGKALSLDTPIPTPGGYVRMADVHIGDTVFGVDGKPTKVTAESRIFDKPMYALSFGNGDVIKASEDHIWTTYVDRQYELPRNMPTKELAAGFRNHRFEVPQAAFHSRLSLTTPLTGIESIPNEPSKCIAVDSPDRLFLCGRHYTATHNTAVLAGLQLFMLMADGEGAPQIYDNATNKDQASLLYGATLKMMRMSGDLSELLEKGEVPDRAQDGIKYAGNFGYITPLTSRTANLDGLDTHFAPLDEMAAYTSGDSYDLLKQSTAAREQPMLYIISSQGFVRNGIFDSRLEYARRWLGGTVEDDTFLPFLYELDDPKEWLDRDCWVKTNPGLGTVKKKTTLEDFVNQAVQEERFTPTVKTKDFNLPQNKATAWLSFEEAVNEATFDVRSMGFKYGVAGFDAANTTDLNAAKMLLLRPDLDENGNRRFDERGSLILDPHIYELSMYWIPSARLPDDSKASRRERDDVPYTLWRDRGLMRVIDGNKVPRYVFIEWLEEIKRELDIYTFAIGYDPWGFQGTDGDNLESYVGKDRCELVRQGAMTLSDPMKQMEADYKVNRYVDNHNPVNEWCRMNVEIVTDRNDNIAPVKKEKKAKHRIDGFMAEVDAYVALLRHWDEYMSVI